MIVQAAVFVEVQHVVNLYHGRQQC
jgi:hypothetical protein